MRFHYYKSRRKPSKLFENASIGQVTNPLNGKGLKVTSDFSATNLMHEVSLILRQKIWAEPDSLINSVFWDQARGRGKNEEVTNRVMKLTSGEAVFSLELHNFPGKLQAMQTIKTTTGQYSKWLLTHTHKHTNLTVRKKSLEKIKCPWIPKQLMSWDQNKTIRSNLKTTS